MVWGFMEQDLLAELSSAVACYLTAMAATADCLEQACPNAGGPYRQRIRRLRARLAFAPTRESLEEGKESFEAELKDYAAVASSYLKERSVEMERGLLGLSDIIEHLGQRHEVFSFRLKEFTSQMENAAYPSGPEDWAKAVTLRAAELRNCIESMEHETASAIKGLFQELAELDRRLAGSESIDPVTGLINLREFNRQVEAHISQGVVFSLLLFEIRGPLSDQVMRQAAANLSERFRHRDRIARWSEREFAVLLAGNSNLAEKRAADAIPCLKGRYTLDNGETVVIDANVSLMRPEAVFA